MHRCSSSLTVPFVTCSQQSLPNKDGGLHQPYLSVSASCLVYRGVAGNFGDHGDRNEDSSGGGGNSSAAVDDCDENYSPFAEEKVNNHYSPSPCRLMRRAALIRRRRVRRLTDGSISPSVYLTSPPCMVRTTGAPPSATDWLYLSQSFQTVPILNRNLQLASDDEDEELSRSINDLHMQLRGEKTDASTNYVATTTGLSPPFSLSSRSEWSTTDRASST